MPSPGQRAVCPNSGLHHVRCHLSVTAPGRHVAAMGAGRTAVTWLPVSYALNDTHRHGARNGGKGKVHSEHRADNTSGRRVRLLFGDPHFHV